MRRTLIAATTLVSAAALMSGAGLALAAVADDIGLTVRVLGTPAEEGGGGKVLMLERGAFAGVHLVPVNRYREVSARLETLT